MVSDNAIGVGNMFSGDGTAVVVIIESLSKQ